jgi:pimeloyl-ACP methyl ester carboxylesterase
VLLAGGCASVPPAPGPTTCLAPPVPAVVPGGRPCGVVLCIPGAGGWPAICESLSGSARSEGLPLVVEPFEWTHGYARVLSDLVDTDHIHEQARRLAGRVCELKQECPSRPISLIGHSAGCLVALEAAAQLPPGTLDHLVLLAPAVSASYDLRPALACARCGVDVFHSRRDLWVLGVGMALVGTADRHWGPVAGRVGFRPEYSCPGDEALFARLRQHPWNACLAWSGNWGGHYSSYEPAFVRAYILPVLCDAR